LGAGAASRRLVTDSDGRRTRANKEPEDDDDAENAPRDANELGSRSLGTKALGSGGGSHWDRT
jgi:hypothetical protein